jgi:hypothetical protein
MKKKTTDYTIPLIGFIILILALISGNVNAQKTNCDEDFNSMAFSYVFPEGLSLEGGRTFNQGFIHTAAIGVGWQVAKYYETKTGIDSIGNVWDMYSYIGWRIFRKDYVLSVYGNIGGVYGNVAGLQPLASIKFLVPIGDVAVSAEPIYILDRGFTGRLSIHFKL